MKVEALIITRQKTPITKTLLTVNQEGKNGIIFEEIFYPLEPKKVFFKVQQTKYIPFIILCPDYKPDIIHSLSEEQWWKRIEESKRRFK